MLLKVIKVGLPTTYIIKYDVSLILDLLKFWYCMLLACCWFSYKRILINPTMCHGRTSFFARELPTTVRVSTACPKIHPLFLW